ncbi:hypothetical protein [Streptomyces tropicalis]|uniref:Integral membrane protein n=1 Tax=Streptomyces tropicalis TaxID=3034234 RepID=A0ABT6AA55_9ACTN|nr:hypothetical protein [Streptomyces tropicalis]MDF3301206.1 hypothetical protein [Streptomyces tropicalis]
MSAWSAVLSWGPVDPWHRNLRHSTRRRVAEAIRRRVRASELDSFDFSGRETVEQRLIRRAIRRAVAREVTIQELSTMVEDLTTNIVAALMILGFAIGALWAGWTFFLGLLVWAAYVTLLFLFLTSRFAASLSAIFAAAILVLLPLVTSWPFLREPQMIASYAGRFGWIPPSWYSPGALESLGVSGLVLTFFFLAVAGAVACDSAAQRRIRTHWQAIGPYDRLLLQWTESVAAVLHSSRDWTTRASIERACQAIRSLASAVLNEFEMDWLFESGSRLHAEHQADAIALSRYVGGYQKHLSHAPAGPELDAVVKDLLDGLAHLALGDRKALLRNIEPVVEKGEEKTWKDTAESVAKRVFPSLILAGAGIGLPYISGVAASGELAGNLRITLVVMAVLSLISAPDDVSKKVNDALAKALPTRKE